MNEPEVDRDDEALARLLRTAGRGATPSAAARARVYARTHDHWRSVTAASLPTAETAPPWPSARRWLALAAALGAVALTVYLARPPAQTPLAALASVVTSEGAVDVLRGEDLRQISAGIRSVRLGDRLTTGPDGKLALLLDNGQQLRVNGNTQLVFAGRDVVTLVRGDLYFDSNGIDAMSPLRIDTNLGIVQHTGTQYSTSVDGTVLRIRVREGSVVFRDAAREIDAVAGQQLRLGRTGDAARSSLSPDDPAWRWVEDLARLPPSAEYALGDVLGWISRETGRRLEFIDGAQTRVRDVALFELQGLSPRETVEAIRATTAFDVRITDDALRVTVAPR